MTEKFLSKQLLVNTKWIRRQNDDDPNDNGGRFPFSLVTYCRICQRQTVHDKITEEKNGAWYDCIGCYDRENLQ